MPTYQLTGPVVSDAHDFQVLKVGKVPSAGVLPPLAQELPYLQRDIVMEAKMPLLLQRLTILVPDLSYPMYIIKQESH